MCDFLMSCYFLFQAGKKLLLGPLHDDLKAELLSSLSKLAFRSTILTIEQVSFVYVYSGIK